MFSGLIILTGLQIIWSKKEKKSYFTFISVLFRSKGRLSNQERLARRIGGFALLIGFSIVLMSGFDELVDSFKHFNDPPAIVRDKNK